MAGGKQREKAERFRALHGGPHVFLLPNAWDPPSARIFEAAGFAAVATTSAGVGFALGYPDGERAPLPEVLAAIARIARAVSIPVSADIETGYGETPEDVGETCRAVLEVGAVGVNLEDGLPTASDAVCDAELHTARIRAAKKAGQDAGVPIVINARTDLLLKSVGPPETRFDRAVARLRAYRAAGADCLFAPGVSEAETIGRLVAALEGPLNVLAVSETPPVSELERLGVRRVTLGSGPMRATLGLLRRIASELRMEGTYRSFTEGAVSYAEANALFERQ
jgi:2-methylisocitrate lyase-like PEP mutase family enzyme